MTEVLKWSVKALLAEIEAEYGNDPTPAGNANAIEGYDVVFRRLSTNIPRDYAKSTLGSRGSTEALVHASLAFSVPFAASGAAGVAPAFGPLLQGCAFGESIVADTSVTYAPVSTGEKSVAFHFFIGGDRCILLGSRGSVSLDFAHGQKPMLRFEFLGLFAAEPTAQSMPALTMTMWPAPKAVSKVNTPTFTLNAVALKLHQLVLNANVERTFRDFTNHNEVVVTGRGGGMTGSLTVLAEALGTWSPFAIARAESQYALALVHGVGAGNVCTIGAPKVQLQNPDYVNVDGQKAISAALLLAESSGNDEWTIAFT